MALALDSTDLRDREQAVVDRLRSDTRAAIRSTALRQELDLLIDSIGARLGQASPANVLSVHLPLIFASAAAGEADAREIDATGVAAACTAVYAGARLFDDLTDGHPPTYFGGNARGSDVLAWATFLLAVPQLVITRSSISDRIQARLCGELAGALANMASGQTSDIASFHDFPSPNAVLDSIAGKSGAMVALFARCGVLAAGAGDDMVMTAGRYGHHLGIGRQLVADLDELHHPALTDTDPACCYAAAVHWAGLEPRGRRGFAGRYRQIGEHESSRGELLRELASSGALSIATMTAELHLSAAASTLEDLTLPPSIARQLREIVEETSPIGRGGTSDVNPQEER